MFSLDGGRTWRDHRVISDRVNFNYTAIREISPAACSTCTTARSTGTLDADRTRSMIDATADQMTL